MLELVVTEKLDKQFNGFHAVDQISLTVHAGEVVVLLGPNGAGKTTTLRLLTSVLKPTSGFARVAGYDVVTQPDGVRRSVGVLTDHHGLYDRMTADEYLVFFGQLYGLHVHSSLKRSMRLLEQFGLSDVRGKRLGEFSRGMRQKVALARALLHEPPVLLLDEPTSAMDPESTRLVRETIQGLRSDDRAILLCTHNLSEAEQLADRIVILREGKVLIQGTPEEIKRALLGAPEYLVCLAKPLQFIPNPLPPGVGLIDTGLDWLRFRIDDPGKTNPLLIRSMIDSGLVLISFQEVANRLEDAYLSLIQQEIDAPLAD